MPIRLFAGQRAASAWVVEQMRTLESMPSKPGGFCREIEPNSSASPVRVIVTTSGLKAPARLSIVPAMKEGLKEEAARAGEVAMQPKARPQTTNGNANRTSRRVNLGAVNRPSL